jgi:hypothetical protein
MSGQSTPTQTPTDIVIAVREINYDPSRKEDFNQNNISELTPFRAYKNDNPPDSFSGLPLFGPRILYVEQSFWDKLKRHQLAIDLLDEYYGKYFGCVTVIPDGELPLHETNDDTGYWLVYRAWCQIYNAENWWQVFGKSGAALIPVSDSAQRLLLGQRQLTPELLTRSAISKLLIDLDTEIKNLQTQCGQQELFIKTSAKSTKHDIPVQTITNAREALGYLLPSPTIQGVLARYEPVELLIRPWLSDVNNDNEIRVFIQDGRIKAISQQYLYSPSPVLGMIFRYSAADILDQIREWWYSTEVQQLGYQDAVLDMYITPDSKVELIEINCGGNGWGPAGSSLFTWAEINSVPKGKCVFAYY